MRFHNLVLGVLGNAAGVLVLAEFMRFPKKVFSGREVAVQAGLSPMGGWRALKNLEAQGVISRLRIGRSDAWKLNEGHFLAQRLAPVFSLERDAMGELAGLLKKHLPRGKVEKAYVFGSVARGEERPQSDIDVLVIVRSSKDKDVVLEAAGSAALEALALFSNHLSVLVFSKSELPGKAGNLLAEVRKEGKLLIDNTNVAGGRGIWQAKEPEPSQKRSTRPTWRKRTSSIGA